MSWTKIGTCVPLTLVSHGRITKHSCMVSGWSELNFLGQQDKNRHLDTPYPRGRNDDRSPSPITGQPPSPETSEFGPEIIPIARPVTIPITLHQKPVKDTGRPRQSNVSTSRLAGRRGSVTSAPSLMSTAGRKNREHCSWCPTSTRLP